MQYRLGVLINTNEIRTAIAANLSYTAILNTVNLLNTNKIQLSTKYRSKIKEQSISLDRVQNGSGAHAASYPMGTRYPSLAVKRPGRETHHSPPSSADATEWVELYLHSPIRLHGVVLS
jgi:hypothetical protein